MFTSPFLWDLNEEGKIRESQESNIRGKSAFELCSTINIYVLVSGNLNATWDFEDIVQEVGDFHTLIYKKVQKIHAAFVYYCLPFGRLQFNCRKPAPSWMLHWNDFSRSQVLGGRTGVFSFAAIVFTRTNVKRLINQMSVIWSINIFHFAKENYN